MPASGDWSDEFDDAGLVAGDSAGACVKGAACNIPSGEAWVPARAGARLKSKPAAAIVT